MDEKRTRLIMNVATVVLVVLLVGDFAWVIATALTAH